MNEVVLDASVVLKWFHVEGEEHLEEAKALRARFEDGALRILAPPLLWLEIINVAARSWGWKSKELDKLARTLPDLGFELVEPGLESICGWCAKGLTAYDACYVSVADETGSTLITDDSQILRVASGIAVGLA